MAARKLTFTVPEEVAGELMRQVSSRDRSHFVTEAIRAMLRSRAERLIKACEVANTDSDVLAIERDWDALPSQIDESWNDPTAR
jgi:hypothetical protein